MFIYNITFSLPYSFKIHAENDTARPGGLRLLTFTFENVTIQCNRCNLQYIGETKRRLKDRFNEHRRTIDNPNTKSKPTTVAQHFLSSPNHTANDMQLIPIEKVFSDRDSIRKAREAFLILKGRTIDPEGLNIREETY